MQQEQSVSRSRTTAHVLSVPAIPAWRKPLDGFATEGNVRALDAAVIALWVKSYKNGTSISEAQEAQLQAIYQQAFVNAFARSLHSLPEYARLGDVSRTSEAFQDVKRFANEAQIPLEESFLTKLEELKKIACANRIAIVLREMPRYAEQGNAVLYDAARTFVLDHAPLAAMPLEEHTKESMHRIYKSTCKKAIPHGVERVVRAAKIGDVPTVDGEIAKIEYYLKEGDHVLDISAQKQLAEAKALSRYVDKERRLSELPRLTAQGALGAVETSVQIIEHYAHETKNPLTPAEKKRLEVAVEEARRNRIAKALSSLRQSEIEGDLENAVAMFDDLVQEARRHDIPLNQDELPTIRRRLGQKALDDYLNRLEFFANRGSVYIIKQERARLWEYLNAAGIQSADGYSDRIQSAQKTAHFVGAVRSIRMAQELLSLNDIEEAKSQIRQAREYASAAEYTLSAHQERIATAIEAKSTK